MKIKVFNAIRVKVRVTDPRVNDPSVKDPEDSAYDVLGVGVNDRPKKQCQCHLLDLGH